MNRTAYFMDKRYQQLQAWLSTDLQLEIQTIEPASADASFRRYFRAKTNKGNFVVMDAPPQHEPLDAFIKTSQALAKLDIHSPEIYQQNTLLGFLLLEDLGHRIYLDELNSLTCEHLYADALTALVKLQQGSPAQLMPVNYSKSLLESEMQLFEDWYIKRHLGLSLSNKQSLTLDKLRRYLVGICLKQPQVWVHRDYHSRNLMITKNNSPGVIDFQDMVLGPISYDLASLFKDCYIQWPREQQIHWLENYLQQAQKQLNVANLDINNLLRWYDMAGLQRHIKVLGIFCRLNYRDNKAQYLNNLPLVLYYVNEVCGLYAELDEFGQLIKDIHAQL